MAAAPEPAQGHQGSRQEGGMNLWVRDSISQIINSPVIHANHLHIHLNLTMDSLYPQPGSESDSGGDSDDSYDGGLAIFRAVPGGDGGGPPDLGGQSAVEPGMTEGPGSGCATDTHTIPAPVTYHQILLWRLIWSKGMVPLRRRCTRRVAARPRRNRKQSAVQGRRGPPETRTRLPDFDSLII